MRRFILFGIILLISNSLFAQINISGKDRELLKARGNKTLNGRQLNDTIGGNKFDEEVDVELSAKTHYTDYKIISYEKDTTLVDTTLTLKKDRIFNYIRKNNFELLAFHNLGQTYNKLGYNFNTVGLFPAMGERAKRYNFYTVEDVNYYRVPTPTSELFFKTGIQQGQVLHSFLTANLTPQLNLSIAYKGLRSLGNYRNALASHQNFSITSSYETKNKRYQARAHYVAHNLMNQENGGLTTESIDLFTTDNPDFVDRERLETTFTDAESLLKAKRYYIEQSYAIWHHKDSISNKDSHLQIGNTFTHSRQYYNFTQEKASPLFGVAYSNTIMDSTAQKVTDNALFLELKSNYVLGKIRGKLEYTNFNYGYTNILYLNSQTVPARLDGYTVSIGADWNAQFKSFYLKAKTGAIIKGDFKGNYIKGTAIIKKDSLFTAKASVLLQSKSPDFNYLLYQSDYIDYNWSHHFDNENTRYLGFSFKSNKWVDAEASITQKDFYTYFDAYSKPQQYSGIVSYLKVRAHKAIRYKKFTLDNTVQYQKVATGNEVFRVPEWITENTLFFSDHLFKGDPLYLQTGISFSYFTKYKADEFNPLLNEFVLQNDQLIGAYPVFDFFINGEIRRTRLFLKAENVSALWSRGNYFVTPTHVYRDFTVRFGLVWNFFI